MYFLERSSFFLLVARLHHIWIAANVRDEMGQYLRQTGGNAIPDMVVEMYNTVRMR